MRGMQSLAFPRRLLKVDPAASSLLSNYCPNPIARAVDLGSPVPPPQFLLAVLQVSSDLGGLLLSELKGGQIPDRQNASRDKSHFSAPTIHKTKIADRRDELPDTVSAICWPRWQSHHAERGPLASARNKKLGQWPSGSAYANPINVQ